jgi:RHS repeat-associated protein
VLAGVGAPGGGTSGVLALTDAHGDVLGQFTAAGTGVQGSQAYDPWGTVTANTGTMTGMLGYQSAWSDPVSGKDLMGARWYNPAAGDFTSADTIQVSPVPDPVAGDPFAYGGDNPLGNVDPTGHYIIPVGNFAPPAPAPEAISSPSCIANIGACLQAAGLVTSSGKIAPPGASVALNNAEETAEANAAKASAAKAKAAAAAKKLAEQKEQEQKAAAAKKAEDALKPADSSCVGRMIQLGACRSERFLAGNTPAQVKQSALGAVLVLTSAIPVADILDLLGGSAAEDGSNVLLDTGSVIKYNSAKTLLDAGEQPVVNETTVQELIDVAACKGFSGAVHNDVSVIADDVSLTLRGQVMQQLRMFGAAVQGMENDAAIGATALGRGYH